jgi:hypothetical protein
VIDRDAVRAAVAALAPATALRGRRVSPTGIRGAMQAVVHWALQGSDDVRLRHITTGARADVLVRALVAGGWVRTTDLTPLLDDLDAGGPQLVQMYLAARAADRSHSLAQQDA